MDLWNAGHGDGGLVFPRADRQALPLHRRQCPAFLSLCKSLEFHTLPSQKAYKQELRGRVFLSEAKSQILNIWTSKHNYRIHRANESQASVQILPHANQTSATIKHWIMSLKHEVWVICALIHSGTEKRKCSLKNIHHPQWTGVFVLPSNRAASLHLWDPWVKTQCQHKSLRVQSGLWHINIDEEKGRRWCISAALFLELMWFPIILPV